MSNSAPTKSYPPSSTLLLIGVLLIGLCLRGPITSIAPIMVMIREQFQLNTIQLSMLTTLPLVAFAVMSPIASRLGISFGIERTLFLSLILMTLGTIVRASNSMSSLFIGTIVIGVGIALANVLLPSLLKRSFAHNITSVTSAYVLMMGLGATVSAGVSLPLADYANTVAVSMPSWSFSLLCPIVMPLIALIVWSPQLKAKQHTAQKNTVENHRYIWSSIEAWKVTSYVAASQLLLYIFIAWWPLILVDSGYTEKEAGFLHSFLQFTSLVPAFILSPLLKRFTKRLVSVAFMLITIGSVLGVLVFPKVSIAWTGLIGFGVGGSLIIAMSLLGQKAQSSQQSAALSGMALCIAYSIAAFGPIGISAIHSYTGNWSIPLLCCVAIAVLGCYLAYIVTTSAVIPMKRATA